MLCLFMLPPLRLLAEGMKAEPEVRPGLTRAEVVELLGEPRGLIESGEVVWLFYDRGQVRLRADRVVEASLVSSAEVAAREEAREAERERRREAGEVLLARALADPGFLARPASERVRFWQNFRQRHPEINVNDPYLAALEEARVDAENARQERRITDLERRVREAEEQAWRAEIAAERARRDPVPRISYRYPLHPVVYQAPTVVCESRRAPSTSVTYTATRGSGTFSIGIQGGTHSTTTGRFLHTGFGFPTQFQQTGGTTGYTHGRSHGLGVDNSTFRW